MVVWFLNNTVIGSEDTSLADNDIIMLQDPANAMCKPGQGRQVHTLTLQSKRDFEGPLVIYCALVRTYSKADIILTSPNCSSMPTANDVCFSEEVYFEGKATLDTL